MEKRFFFVMKKIQISIENSWKISYWFFSIQKTSFNFPIFCIFNIWCSSVRYLGYYTGSAVLYMFYWTMKKKILLSIQCSHEKIYKVHIILYFIDFCGNCSLKRRRIILISGRKFRFSGEVKWESNLWVLGILQLSVLKI